MTEVRAAQAGEKTDILAILQLAFATDPPTRWLIPKPADYVELYASFAAAFGGRAFDHETALVTTDGRAAALWLPPGVAPDQEAMGPVFEKALARRGGTPPAIGEQMDALRPKEPHWYLPLIGVDPAHQGRGLGSALLASGLARVDAEGAIAYLESSNEKNIPLYERFGFEVVGFVQAGDFPGLWPMLRKAQG
ncbi:MAG TPA: N-acetyltransferase [Caulobacteraceae bacterium]|nr:N-acetyltransferase [Caulobacteraceae bacterium]